MEEPRQAGFLDHVESTRSKHLPVVEPKNKHGPLRQIEHGAGTEHPYHLAQSNFVFCHRLARFRSGAGRRGR
jgi:hypothetical protein